MTCLHSYADRLQRITRPDCSALPDAVKKWRGGGSRGKLQSRLLFVAKPSTAPQPAVKSEMQTKQVLLWRDGDVIAVTQKLLRSVGMCGVYPHTACPSECDTGLLNEILNVYCHYRQLCALPNAS